MRNDRAGAIDYASIEEAAQFELSGTTGAGDGQSYEVEETFDSPEGQRTRIVRKHRVTMETGRHYVLAFLVDVTQVKNRETEAIEARRHLAHVLDSLPAGIIIYDNNDRFVMANRWLQQAMPAWSRLGCRAGRCAMRSNWPHDLGFFRNTGDVVLDSLYESDRAAWLELYLQRYHKPFIMTERSHPDGRWYQAYDLRTADGTFIGVRMDITEIKEREAALREAMLKLDLFRRVLDELPVATNIKSEQLVIEYVNKTWCAITGIPAEEAIGSTDLELFDAACASGYTADDHASATSGVGVETEETVPHRDGTVRQLHDAQEPPRQRGRDDPRRGIEFGRHRAQASRDASAREPARHRVFRSLIDNLPVAIYAKKST